MSTCIKCFVPPAFLHALIYSLLREYLELEFSGIPTPFPLDAERLVDDFVLFCMLVGNDFLPGGVRAVLRTHACSSAA
jgi:5'-3' exoribonuclease 1